MNDSVFVLNKTVLSAGEFYYSEVLGAYETRELLIKAVADDISTYGTRNSSEDDVINEEGMQWEYFDCHGWDDVYYKGYECPIKRKESK